jgi:hypothetical protein
MERWLCKYASIAAFSLVLSVFLPRMPSSMALYHALFSAGRGLRGSAWYSLVCRWQAAKHILRLSQGRPFFLPGALLSTLVPPAATYR